MASELLDYHNVLLKSILTEAVIDNQPPKKLDQVVSDFDNVKFHIRSLDDTKIVLSMAARSWPDLQNYGVDRLLQREYGPYITDVEDGYDFSMLVDLTSLPEGLEERTLLVNNMALLRRNALAAPFEEAFSSFDKMAKEAAQVDYYQPPASLTQLMVLNYRDEESIYIQPSFDRVTVIFSTIFKDETDQVLGKVFLQEFVDARRRALQNAPQVLFSKEPPLELQSTNARAAPNVSFVTFVLFPSHIIPQRREQCISHIQTFRDYFHYHIKNSKAYVHSRMRYRTDEFLKVLNRAKPENAEKDYADRKRRLVR